MTTTRAGGLSPPASDEASSPHTATFDGSRACFEDIVGWLEGTEASSWSHGELEDDLDRRGRKLLRRLLQDHLEGKARDVATGIRRRATTAALSKPKRKKADECAKYLINKAAHLDYPTALAAGWPIATGVIEGTCRYLVADRMDITGARWSVQGAEAVLNYEPSDPTATSTHTGNGTSSKNGDESTKPATPTASSPSPHSHSTRAAPNSIHQRVNASAPANAVLTAAPQPRAKPGVARHSTTPRFVGW